MSRISSFQIDLLFDVCERCIRAIKSTEKSYDVRRGYVINITLKEAVEYVKDMKFNNFDQLFSCCMVIDRFP